MARVIPRKVFKEYLYYCPDCPFASDFRGDMRMHLEVLHSREGSDYMLQPHKHWTREEGEMPKHKVPPKCCGNCRHFDEDMNYCDEIAIITSAECPPCEDHDRESN